MGMDEKLQVKKKVIKGAGSTKQDAVTASGRTKKLAVTGLFIAMNLVLNQVTIPIGTTMEIGFAFIPIALIGYLYGPLTAGLSGVVADILGFMLRPAGFFFPGFTLNEFIVGVLCGLFLHKKTITLWRVALLRLTNTIIISLILTPTWLYIMYETPFVTIPRIIKAVVKYPIDVTLLYLVLVAFAKYVEKERKVH